MQTTTASQLKPPSKPDLPKPVPPTLPNSQSNPDISSKNQDQAVKATRVAEPTLKVSSPPTPHLTTQTASLPAKQPELNKATSQVKPVAVQPVAQAAQAIAKTEIKEAKSDKKKTDKASKKTDTKFVGLKKRPGKKKIPTILALAVLLVSLVAGLLLFNNGTGVFSPRATPETTPQRVRISNVTDKTFTVSFFTDEATVAYIKYGTDANKLDQQSSDDRDQLSGVVKPYRLHHVTVRGLEPNTDYFYVLGTDKRSTFDNDGLAYQLTTAKTPSTNSPNNQTIYGQVNNSTGAAAEGAVVFVDVEGAGLLSTLVKSSGSWAISLSNAFNLALDNYPIISDDTQLSLEVQGIQPSLTNQYSTTVAAAQPVLDLTLGVTQAADQQPALVDREELLAEDQVPEASTATEASASTELTEQTEDMLASDSAGLMADEATEQTSSSASALATELEADRVLDLNSLDQEANSSTPVLSTSQPVIKAKLPANITVQLEIHSDSNISQTLQTDANGELMLDLASLEENLDPGEHTVSYTYIDPITGQEVTESYTFTVAEDADMYGAGAGDDQVETLASSETYGSGNPYVPTTTLTASPTAAVSSQSSSLASSSARSSTVSTSSCTYNAGSTLNTIVLLLAGLFFVTTGVWSFYLAKEFQNR